MRKSISKRIKITKKGSIKRRAMALGHSRANKSGVQMFRKQRERSLQTNRKYITRQLSRT